MNKYLKYSLILIVILIVFFFTYYELFNQFLITGNTPIESNNTTIQFILLVTGIITIFFLYINYDLQRKQIKSQQEEIEFNRVLDFIYKHRDNTTISLNELAEKRTFSVQSDEINWTIENFLQEYIDLKDGQIGYKDIQSFELDKYIVKSFIHFKGRLNTYVDFFSGLIKVYKRMIVENSILKDEDKGVLGLIIQDMFYRDEIHKISRYYEYLKSHYAEIEPYLEKYYGNIEYAEKTKESVEELIAKIEVLKRYFK